MRLLQVTPSYLPALRYGGVVRSVHGLARSLAARGHELTVFTTDADGPRRVELGGGSAVDRDGVSVRYFPTRLYRPCWAPALGRALRRELPRFDAVHIHGVFLWPGLAAARAARRAGVPYLLSPRGMLVRDLVRRRRPLLKRAWIALFERKTVEGAAALHATSALEAEELRGFGFRLPAIHVVPNGIDATEAAAPGPPSPAIQEALVRRPLVLFLGRVNWKKGLDRLLAALPAVERAQLVVAGNDEEGYAEALARQARGLGVRDRVHFVGPVDGADKAALLRGADVFVLPSYSENFGNAVLEAMSAACPVVVTPEVGLAQDIAASGAGVVTTGEPAPLAAALRAVLDRPEDARALGRRGRALVLERYTWEKVAERMEPILAGLAASARA